MSLRRALLLIASLAAVLAAAMPAGAQSLPANPGDFAVNIDLGGEPAPGAMPTCDPSLDSLASLFMSGQTSVNAKCSMSDSATGKTTTGTVANATMAAQDPGFNNGSINAVCDSSQATSFNLAITMAGSQMSGFGGTAFYACAFTMSFQDAQRSTLTGTIEVNATLGSGSATDAANTITIMVKGKVYVTGGTGTFAGATGTGTFDQTQTMTIPSTAGAGGSAAGGGTAPSSGTATAAELAVCSAVGVPSAQCNAQAVAAICAQAGANPQLQPLCAAAGRRLQTRISTRANASSMKLTLKKGAGAARILVPAAPAGKPGAKATVKASTKVKLAVTKGASCTVKSNTGKVVGSGKAGAKSTLTIRPKAGAYTGASSITATCTNAGKTFTSNKVKITL